jgi:hypothetical protein
MDADALLAATGRNAARVFGWSDAHVSDSDQEQL